MVKRLTLADMKTVEQHRAEMEKLTEEDVQGLGHPSKKVMRLEWRLSEIAGKWRDNQNDMGLVHEYKSVLYEMILNGYDVNTLPIQDQLPDRLMPELPPKPVQMAIQSVYQTE